MQNLIQDSIQKLSWLQYAVFLLCLLKQLDYIYSSHFKLIS